jgi:hypothetical protein
MRSIQLTDHVCPRPSSRGSATELVVKENRYEQTEARHSSSEASDPIASAVMPRNGSKRSPGSKTASELEHLNQAARQMLDQLAWWTAALKAAREKSLRQAA